MALVSFRLGRSLEKRMWLRKSFLAIIVGGAIIILLVPLIFWRIKKRGEEKMPKFSLSVRRPAVAGMFYPGEKEALQEKIDFFLKKIRPVIKKEKILKVLIVPHAGYDYSGQVAASGFKQLEGKNYSRVILIGGSHTAWFSGVAVDANDAWETPLGQVLLDKDLSKRIVEKVTGAFFSQKAHRGEHSLEVELPFLQQVLKDFKIVPILLGEGVASKNLAEVLAENIDRETLVVISTDLSHYPPYEVAKEVDRKTIEAILSGDPQNFEATISAQMEKGYPNLSTCACGQKAVEVAMMLAQKLGKGKWQLLKYANSGEVGIGDKSRVVGYAALGFFAKNAKLKAQNEKLPLKAQSKLLKIARKTLESYLTNKKIPKFKIEDKSLKQKLGAFVTLRKNGQLRGCIGQIEPTDEPLWKVVQKMAVEAALRDPRFPPVSLEELKEIKIEVSVLSKPKKIDDPFKIELGKHGVIIKWGFRSGVFLPQVAQETNWDLDTFMGQLCLQKVGLSWDCWKKGNVEIFVFKAQVFEE